MLRYCEKQRPDRRLKNGCSCEKKRLMDKFEDGVTRLEACCKFNTEYDFPCPCPYEKYEFGSQIGRGGNSTVYAGQERLTGRLVALKVTDVTCSKDGQPQEVFYHTSAAKNNPGVLKVLDWYQYLGKVALVMERFEPCTNLNGFISTFWNGVPNNICRTIFTQIVTAVRKCHQNGVFHGDIKIDNILINPDTYETKLIDFGSSMPAKQKYVKQMFSSYQIPEMQIKCRCMGERADVWLLGIVLFVMKSREHPFPLPNKFNDLMFDFNPVMDLLYGEGEAFKDLVSRMLCVNEATRITINEVALHPWITDTDV